MQKGPKVTVAGAGALGLSCALALARAGCRVTVCDPAPPLANASGVAGGMLAPAFEAALDPEAAPHFDLLLAARDLWAGFAPAAGVVLDRSGALAAGRPDWLSQVAAKLHALGTPAMGLSDEAAQALAPGLAPGLRFLLNREDWRLDAPRALGALRRAAEAAGAVFEPRAVDGRGDADLLVVATGAAQGLAPETARLSPIKGHILRVAPSALGGVTVRGEGVYVVRAGDGLAIGATMEPGLADATPDPERGAPLLAAGAALFPQLADARYVLQAGVRAATPDGLPLAGWSAEPGVLVAAGARRNGWLLAPLVAQVIAACVTEGEAGPHARRLDPQRFGEAR